MANNNDELFSVADSTEEEASSDKLATVVDVDEENNSSNVIKDAILELVDRQHKAKQHHMAEEEEEENKLLTSTQCTDGPTSGMQLPGAVRIRGLSQRDDDDEDEFSSSCFGMPTQEELQESPVATLRSSLLETTSTTTVVATAFKVEERDVESERVQIEEQVRSRIIQEAVEADVVVEVTSDDTNKQYSAKNGRSWRLGCVLVSLFVIAVANIAVAVTTTTTKDDNSSNSRHLPTLAAIRERGFVRCGIFLLPGFASENEDTGKYEGTNIDQCGAISIAIFGTPDNVEYVLVDYGEKFQMLANKTIDIVTTPASLTFDRDVYESSSKSSLTYTTLYHYTGVTFNGVPEYVDCAERLDTFSDETCRLLNICVIEGSRVQATLNSFVPGGPIQLSADTDALVENLKSGVCNVYAGHPALLNRYLSEIDFDFKHGTQFLSKELMGLVTRNDDNEFSNLVNLVVNVFILADSENITKSNSLEIEKFFVSAGDEEHTNNTDLAWKMVEIISEYGNHGEIYSKYFGPIEAGIAGSPINRVYNPNYDDSGLLYTIPFGDVKVDGPSPIQKMTLDTIINRENLRCGVVQSTHHPGFSALDENTGIWSGFDVEFCRAVAGAIFSGSVTNTVEIISLPNSTEAYISLSNGSVDVVAGARVTLEADYCMPLTGEGYTFSTPYFYDKKNSSIGSTSSKMDAFAMMTSENDKQWSDFVYWVVISLIYADENNIDQSSFSQMPAVNLFGEHLKQMFRFSVMAVGSYGQIYNRTLENTIPRSGANTLNSDSSGPQLFPIPYH